MLRSVTIGLHIRIPGAFDALASNLFIRSGEYSAAQRVMKVDFKESGMTGEIASKRQLLKGLNLCAENDGNDMARVSIAKCLIPQ